jgi:4-methyl-5(b-hydroxyethyl)-thiazole monophosphate biosynthesis
MARVLVPLADGCEELEAVTIIDLLRRAGIEVVTAGLSDGPVTASRGVVLIPDRTLDAVLDEPFDMIVLPGGLPGADHLDADPRIHKLLQQMADDDRYTAAICAAPKVLLNAGLLDNRRATAYPGLIDKAATGSAQLTGAPVEVDGRVVTSRGPGTAMDFALALIEQLQGAAKRQEVESPLVRP